MLMQRARCVALAFLAGCAAACGAATPRLEDAAAPGDFYDDLAHGTQPCEPKLALLRTTAEAVRPYRELARVSATCSPGSPRLCERRLVERGCELKADAVILIEARAAGTPAGASSQSSISRAGIAVLWRDR